MRLMEEAIAARDFPAFAQLTIQASVATSIVQSLPMTLFWLLILTFEATPLS
jgi:hypothetical protein